MEVSQYTTVTVVAQQYSTLQGRSRSTVHYSLQWWVSQCNALPGWSLSIWYTTSGSSNTAHYSIGTVQLCNSPASWVSSIRTLQSYILGLEVQYTTILVGVQWYSTLQWWLSSGGPAIRYTPVVRRYGTQRQYSTLHYLMEVQ